MLFYNIAFKCGNIEIFLGIFERFASMSKSVKALSLSRLMCMPVIKEEVMQKSGTGTGSLIKVEQLAKLIIIVGNIQTMLKTGRASVMSEILHLTDNAAFEKIGNEGVILAVFIFKICLKTNGF